MDLGAEDYREASSLRIEEAHVLYDAKMWVGAVYLAGRAVEAILRNRLWLRGSQQATGHNLKLLMMDVYSLKLLDDSDRYRIEDRLNEIAVVWRNDLRFTGERRFRRILKDAGRLDRVAGQPVKGDPLKANAKSVLEACDYIVARLEPSCRN